MTRDLVHALAIVFVCSGGCDGTGENMAGADLAMAQETCSDGKQNGTESDVDCGGSCAACAEGKMCLRVADCQSHSCVNNVCAPSMVTNCSDQKKDGTESDVDCG